MNNTTSNIFPNKKLLEEATIQALKSIGTPMSVKQINNKVIEILNLPDEVVQLEDETGQGTMLQFRLRWIRTELKNKGKIVKLGKGMWQISENEQIGET